MARDTGIADRLRAAGLKVVEVDGWKTRGSETFTPRGSVDHHTAGSAKGNAPSLGICINGRADLPGPLCHVLVGRDLTCYVIAAGRANHAGSGGWKGLSGNSSVYGVERENVGTAAEPWRPEQTAHAAKVHAALLNYKNSDLGARHAEWAPTRKVDTHSISGAQLRLLVAQQAPPAPPGDDDDMAGYVPYLCFQFTDGPDTAKVWCVDSGYQTKRHIKDNTELAGLLYISAIAGGAKEVYKAKVGDALGKMVTQARDLDTMVTDAELKAALDKIPAAVVKALPPTSTGGITEAQVEAACEKAIKDTGLLGLLPGQ